MSSDNYYVVRKHPLGGFTYVMGFASDEDDEDAPAHERDPQYPTVLKAFQAAGQDYSEYGVSIHEECEDSK